MSDRDKEIMYYVIQILIILAKTSDMNPIMKDIRVTLLSKIAEYMGEPDD